MIIRKIKYMLIDDTNGRPACELKGVARCVLLRRDDRGLPYCCLLWRPGDSKQSCSLDMHSDTGAPVPSIDCMLWRNQSNSDGLFAIDVYSDE